MADSVGSVSVDVVPDARGWSEKLRAQLRDVTVNVPVDADTAKATAKLDKLGAESPEVKVDVDDAEATTKLTLIQGQVDKLDGRTANVKVKTDKSQFSQATSALDGFLGKIGMLPALAATAGSALIPLGAAIGGVAAALAAPLAIAGGGVGLFAVLGGLAVKNTEKQLKDIDKMRTKLGTLQKGTAEYAAAQKQLKMATDALSPAQDRLSKAQGTLSGAFTKLVQGKAGEALLDPIAQGMNLLAGILPRLTPLITAVSGALTDLLDGVAKATSGPGFGKFIGQISKMVGPDIEAFGHIIGGVAKGVGSLLLTLGKSDFSGGLLKQLEGFASAFSDWASSKKGRDQVQAFLGYVQDVGPQVASVLGKIARAFVKIVEALAPLGPPVLKVIGGIADALSAIPIPVLTALAGTAASLVLLQKTGGLKLIGALSKGAPGTGVKGALTSAFTGGVQHVWVDNPGFGGTGGPGGTPEGKVGTLGKLGLGAVGIPAVGAIAEGTRGILQKVLGDTFGGALGAAGFGAIGVPTVDPRIAVAQGHLWDQVFQGHFSKALDMLKAPGPVVDPNAGKLSPSKLSMFRGGGPVAPSILAGPLPFAQAAQSIKATTTAVDGLKGASAQASHQIDLLGPQSVQASNVAVGAFHRAQGALNAIHDKRIQIIVDDQGLISRLQAINNMVIHDKTFTVTQISRVVERNVGPGGGIHQLPTTAHAAGGWIRGPGTGTSDSIPTRLSTGEFVVNAAAAAANRDWLNQINNSRRAPGYAMGGPVRAGAMGPVHVTVVGHVDEDGYITGTSQDVYAANNDFERAHG